MKNTWFKKIICCVILAAFVATSVAPSYAQSVLQLPQPGTMVNVSPKVDPPMLKGLKIDPQDPFRFEFILDKGEDGSVETRHTTSLQNDATRLIKYFLAALTIPEKDLWVNLSPYEKDRIIPDTFGLTEMGRDLLAQDYILKQITASLIYPEGETGRKFWAEVYKKSYDKYGTTDIPVDTFNKVWVVPAKAVVYENAKAATAYVVESKLKVMLESDYVAQENNVVGLGRERADTRSAPTNEMTKSILREIILPVLEKEINEGANFAQLRQVYHSLILAAWYKRKIKASLLSSVYVDQKKVAGVNIDDPKISEKIWAQYVEAFKRGAYNYIKEEYDQYTQETVPRKYFSGGMNMDFAMNNALAIVDALPTGALLQENKDAAEGLIDAISVKIVPGGTEAFSRGLFGKNKAASVNEPVKDEGKKYPFTLNVLEDGKVEAIDARGMPQDISLKPWKADMRELRSRLQEVKGSLTEKAVLMGILDTFEQLPAELTPRFYLFDEALQGMRDVVSVKEKIIAIRQSALDAPEDKIPELIHAMMSYLIDLGPGYLKLERDSQGNQDNSNWADQRWYLRVTVQNKVFGLLLSKGWRYTAEGAHTYKEVLLKEFQLRLFGEQEEILQERLKKEDMVLELQDLRQSTLGLMAQVSLLGDFNKPDKVITDKDGEREVARIGQLPHIAEAMDIMSNDYTRLVPQLKQLGPMMTRANYHLYDEGNRAIYEKADTILKTLLEKNGIPAGAMELRIVKQDQRNAFVIQSLPNVVFVTSGLLQGAQEDTIAAIMGHEISHLIFYFKKILQNRWGLFHNRSSAGQEEYADILGVRLADTAGYDVTLFPDFFVGRPSDFPTVHNSSYRRVKNLERYIQETPFRNKLKGGHGRFSGYISFEARSLGYKDLPYQEIRDARSTENIRGSFNNIESKVRQVIESRAEDTPKEIAAAAEKFIKAMDDYVLWSNDDSLPLWYGFLWQKIDTICSQFRNVDFPGMPELRARIYEARTKFKDAIKAKFFRLGLKVEWYPLAMMSAGQNLYGLKPEEVGFYEQLMAEKDEYYVLLDALMDDPQDLWGMLSSEIIPLASFHDHVAGKEKFRKMRQVVGDQEYARVITTYIAKGSFSAASVEALSEAQLSLDEIYNIIKKLGLRHLHSWNSQGKEAMRDFVIKALPRLGTHKMEVILGADFDYIKGFPSVLSHEELKGVAAELIKGMEQTSPDRRQDEAQKKLLHIIESSHDMGLMLFIEERVKAAEDLGKWGEYAVLKALLVAARGEPFFESLKNYYNEKKEGYPVSSIVDRSYMREYLPSVFAEFFGGDGKNIIDEIGQMHFVSDGVRNALLFNYYISLPREGVGKEELFQSLVDVMKYMRFDKEDSERNQKGMEAKIKQDTIDDRGILMGEKDRQEYKDRQKNGKFYDGKYYFVDLVTDIPEIQADLMLIEKARADGFLTWLEDRINNAGSLKEKVAVLLDLLPRVTPLRDQYLEHLADEVFKQTDVDIVLAEKVASGFRSPELSVSYKLKLLDRDVTQLKASGVVGSELALKKLEAIRKYFPRPSLVRDDLLDSYIDDHVTEVPDYRVIKQLYYSFYVSDGKSIEGDEDEYVDNMVKVNNQAVFLLNKIPGHIQKVEFLLWLMGMHKERPPVVQKLELELNLDLGYLKDKFLREMPLDNFRNTGKSANAQLFHALLWDEHTGLASDAEKGNRQGLWEDFMSALYEGMMGEKGGLLYDVWMSFFMIAPKHNWLMTEKTLFNLLAQLSQTGFNEEITKAQKEELIVKFLQSIGVIGIKLGQVLHSFGYLEDSLGDQLESLKSKLPIPFSKREFFRFLDMYDIDDMSVKGLINEASIKAVFDAERHGKRLAAKYKKPAGDQELADGFTIMDDVLEDLDRKGYKQIPRFIITFLQEYLKREMSFEEEHNNQVLLKKRLKEAGGTARTYWNKIKFLSSFFGSPKDILAYLKEKKAGIKMFDVDTPDQELVNQYLLGEEFIVSGDKAVGEDMKPFLQKMIIDLLSYGVIHTDLHEQNLIIDLKGKVWVIDTASVKLIELKTILQLMKLLRVLQEKNSGKIFRVLGKLFPKMLANKDDRAKLRSIVEQALIAQTPLEAILFITREVSEYNYDFLESLKSVVSFKHLLGIADSKGTEGLSSESMLKKGAEEARDDLVVADLSRDGLVDEFKKTPAIPVKERILDELIKRGKIAYQDKDEFKKYELKQVYELFMPYTLKQNVSLAFRTKIMRSLRILSGTDILFFNNYQNYANANVVNDLRQKFMDDPDRLFFNVTPDQTEVQEYLAEVLYILQFHKLDQDEQEQLKKLAVDERYSRDLRGICALALVNTYSLKTIEVLDTLASRGQGSLDLEEVMLKRMSRWQLKDGIRKTDAVVPEGTLESFDPVFLKDYIHLRSPHVFEEGRITQDSYIAAFCDVLLGPLKTAETANDIQGTVVERYLRRKGIDVAVNNSRDGLEYFQLMMPDAQEKVGSRARAMLDIFHRNVDSEYKSSVGDMFFYYAEGLDQMLVASRKENSFLEPFHYDQDGFEAAAKEVVALIDANGPWILAGTNRIKAKYLLLRLYLLTGGDVVHKDGVERLFSTYWSHIDSDNFYDVSECLTHLRDQENFFRGFPAWHQRIASLLIEDMERKMQKGLSYMNMSTGSNSTPSETYLGRLIMLIHQYALTDLQGHILPQKALELSHPRCLPVFDGIVKRLTSEALLNKDMDYRQRYDWIRNLDFLMGYLEKFPRFLDVKQEVALVLDGEENMHMLDREENMRTVVNNHFYNTARRFVEERQERKRIVLYEANDSEWDIKDKVRRTEALSMYGALEWFFQRLLVRVRNEPDVFTAERRHEIATALRQVAGEVRWADGVNKAAEEIDPSVADAAMADKGGIDLNPVDGVLDIKNSGAALQFNITPAMLQRYQSAPGFMPVIINVQPVKDLSNFLGIS